ncbi:hypothetical protein C5167_041345 [Papaver somniferum]|uniref:SET domain-containing protein n=1 Tax=Papaver somniferum TaxID=3469 RepID=A0A4Y7IHM7_PAPSO|nr:probable inactive histone-lysine N-methyltransferase SUVR2 [Papaver somniferum]XP_026428651.1 probable inactive histone-lysine N-methyltransferase SUVR2 [Papaver somniferum]RZC48397.1 hypothetical protein C5167_041345 [Papaver somniferum]
MTMNPRVAMAFSAMKEIGLSEKKVKPVLKNLLRVYDKNWELIEDENYRVLADAILDYQEEHKEDVEKQKRKKKEVVESHEDSEPPRLKRLRQDCQSPRPLVRRQMGPNFDLTPRVEGIESYGQGMSGHGALPLNMCMLGRNELPPYEDYSRDETEEPPAQLQLRRKRSEQAQPVSPHINFEDRGRGSLLAPTICKRSEREVPTAPIVVCLKEPKTEPGIEPLPPKKNLASGAQTKVLVKPKTEPCNDGFQPSGVPAAATLPPNPDCRRTQGHKDQNVSSRRHGVEALPSRDADAQGHEDQNVSSRQHGVEALPSRDADVENGSLRGSGTLSKNGGLELADVAEATRASVELASSTSGEVKISLSCNYFSGQPNFRLPSMDEVFKMVEDKCLKSYKIIDPNFSLMNLMKEMCQCISDRASDSTDDNQETLMQITPDLDSQERSNMRISLGATSDHEDSILIPPTSINRSVSSHSSAEVIEPHTPQRLALNGVVDLQGTIIQPNEEVLSGGGNGSDMIVEQTDVRSSSPSGFICVRQEISTPDDIRSADDTLVVVRPSHDVNDISKGQENLPISTVNEVSSAPYPPLFYYISKNTIFRSAHVNCSLSRVGDEDCCIGCFGDCVSSSIPCACARITGGDFAYTLDGLLKENFLEECISVNRDPQNHLFYCKSCPLERCKDGDMPDPCKGHLMRKFIKECWSKCGCNKQCGNRVVQRGISCNLQVFLTAEGKGWGLRTLMDLPRGSFVCEYVGEILTSKELYERNKEITDVDVLTSNVLLDAAWGSDGVVKDKDALCLDATFYGNVARFINHRCFDANLVEVPVEVESPNHRYYHLAFFTTRDVEALEELTWDYGIDFSNRSDSVKGFRCFCRSKDCRDVKRQYI